MGMFADTAITVCPLRTRNFYFPLPFAAKKWKFAVFVFPFAEVAVFH
jgi:hypothetical protein